MTEAVQTKLEDGGAFAILLNRPEHRNALTAEMITRLTEGLQHAGRTPEARIIVLRATGLAFCAGLDLDEFYGSAEGSPADHELEAQRLTNLFLALHHSSKPVVAVVQGKALGVGATIAAACDIVIASSHAQFGFPEVTFGFVPAFASAILRRLMGEKAAFELLATGRTIKADEARALGLVSRVVPEEGLDAVTGSSLKGLCVHATETMASLKRLFADLDGTSFDEAMSLSATLNARAHATRAFREAAQQFLAMA